MQPNVKGGRLIDVDHEPRNEEGYDQADAKSRMATLARAEAPPNLRQDSAIG
jgi:hypothetical protein